MRTRTKELILEKCSRCGKWGMVQQTPRGLGLVKGECTYCCHRKLASATDRAERVR